MKTTEKDLFNKAIELFKKHGYNNVSVNQICKECHVTKGSFYHHFKSKEDILKMFYTQLFDDPQDLLLQLANKTTYKEKLWCVLEYGMIPTVALGPELLFEMMKISILPDYSSIEKARDYTADLIITYIKKAKESNEIHNPNTAEDLWFAYQNGLYGIAMDWSTMKGQFDEIEQLKKLFEIIFY